MKIRILCMIALILSATACSNPPVEEIGTKKAGFLNFLGMDSNTAHMVKNG